MSFRDLDQTGESRARLRRSVAREIQERSLATSRSTAAWAPCHVREIDTRIRHRLRSRKGRRREVECRKKAEKRIAKCGYRIANWPPRRVNFLRMEGRSPYRPPSSWTD